MGVSLKMPKIGLHCESRTICCATFSLPYYVDFIITLSFQKEGLHLINCPFLFFLSFVFYFYFLNKILNVEKYMFMIFESVQLPSNKTGSKNWMLPDFGMSFSLMKCPLPAFAAIAINWAPKGTEAVASLVHEVWGTLYYRCTSQWC